MSFKISAFRFKKNASYGGASRRRDLKPKTSQLKAARAFTLIETLVAIAVLVFSVAAPMSLAAQSLSSAFYARDQVTAFHLAQEAIEAIRSVRDGNALLIINGTSVDLLAGVPSVNGASFTVDTRTNAMELCIGADTDGDGKLNCSPLKNNGDLYGYGTGGSWDDTRFTRTVFAENVGVSGDEVRISVMVSWRTGVFSARSFTISENLYKWVE